MAISITSTDTIGSSGCKQKSKCMVLIATAFPFRWLRSSDVSEYWGDTKLTKEGKMMPMTDGPRKMPAKISSISASIPIRNTILPKKNETVVIIIS